MAKDVLIIANFISLPNEKGNDRFFYLANILKQKNNDVEIVSSDFSHIKKCHRNNVDQVEGVKITLLHEVGYKKNVSIKRIFSHKTLAKSIKKYLSSRKLPDVIYCAVPSLDVGDVVSRFAKKNNIEFIIDIQDLWPEAFEMVLKLPVINKIMFYPMRTKADRIYNRADKIIAVSETYMSRAVRSLKRKVQYKTVFLGTDIDSFDHYAGISNFRREKNEILLAYCGTLGHSYDLTCLFKAMKLLMIRKEINIRLIVMGDGPLKHKFENISRDYGVDVTFYGRLSYPEMCGILSKCDIAINPISHGAAQSIINKHADYAASGIPVISTQENEEYRKLVEEYKMGINCRNSDAEDIANKIEMLSTDDNLRTIMGKNARKCAIEKFDRKKTYSMLADFI